MVDLFLHCFREGHDIARRTQQIFQGDLASLKFGPRDGGDNALLALGPRPSLGQFGEPFDTEVLMLLNACTPARANTSCFMNDHSPW